MINLVQITDLHLREDPKAWLNWGHPVSHCSPWDNLDAVLKDIQQLAIQPDLLVISGDLAEEETLKTYKQLHQRLLTFSEDKGLPIVCLPGNHDEVSLMHKVFTTKPIDMPNQLRLKSWQLLFLDTTYNKQQAGYLHNKQLIALEQQLQEQPRQPTLIFMHHHPIPVNSTWMDRMMLQDNRPFLDLIEQHPQIKAIAHGHIHQGFEGQYKHIAVFGTASTCVQFKTQHAHAVFDDKAPAYRCLQLHDNGTIQSQLHYVKDYQR